MATRKDKPEGPGRVALPRPSLTPRQALFHALGAADATGPDIQAFKACMRGEATPGQQRRVMVFIIDNLCGVARTPFTLDPRVTDLRMGAQTVGQAIAMIAEMTVLSLPAMTPENAAREPQG